MTDDANCLASPKGPMIKLAGVRKSFDGQAVLDGVDLEVDDGESVVIIGPSGSGKTVLLKAVVGLIAPDSGSIRIAGMETAGMATRERDSIAGRIGMLFQQSALYDSMRIWKTSPSGR